MADGSAGFAVVKGYKLLLLLTADQQSLCQEQRNSIAFARPGWRFLHAIPWAAGGQPLPLMRSTVCYLPLYHVASSL